MPQPLPVAGAPQLISGQGSKEQAQEARPFEVLTFDFQGSGTSAIADS
ncbi:MAG TPA: hypothetical protein V6D14_14365 [Coleofasciculaceae cyanobacterium]